MWSSNLTALSSKKIQHIQSNFYREISNDMSLSQWDYTSLDSWGHLVEIKDEYGSVLGIIIKVNLNAKI